ncbi:RHS repeat domain-containing protein [Stenotrophomonas sp. LGBM10]|uniref:RHS repeat domain-containing protein n=1 Tax=Stenotrophomonas sp. LGBM10 TaxID=3390038 RepID=UPI00398B976F
MRRQLGVVLAGVLLLLGTMPLDAFGQASYGSEERAIERVKSAMEMRAVKVDGAFGETWAPYNGAVAFDVVDVSLPGNSELPVEFRRSMPIRERRFWHPNEARMMDEFGGMDDWNVDLPMIYGMFSQSLGWQTADANPYARCSAPLAPKSSSTFHKASDFWKGYQLRIPGDSTKTLLDIRATTGLVRPETGRAYSLGTKDFWMVSCLPATKNGYPGEGFLVESPSGLRYYMDWVITKAASGSTTYTAGRSAAVTQSHPMARSLVYFTTSRIEDRFGNYVNFNYDGARLTRIESNDGRWINVGYSGNRVATVDSALGRWTYGYSASGMLSKVSLPDGSAWSYQGAGALESITESFEYSDAGPPTCANVPYIHGLDYAYTVRNPAGATAKFDFSFVGLSRSNVPKMCNKPSYVLEYWVIPPTEYSYALIKKTVEGAGLGSLVWQYGYASGSQVWEEQCASLPTACALPRVTNVVHPDGRQEVYEHGNMYNVNDGLLLKQRWSNANGTVRELSNEYQLDATGQAFPEKIGSSRIAYTSLASIERLQPLKKKVIAESGDQYAREILAFDALARPLTTRVSSPWYARVDTLQFADSLGLWVLGQIARSTNDETGLVEASAVYDSRALPAAQWSFGNLQQEFTYHPDGNVASVKDANGNVTKLEQWMRGIPRWIRFADGTMKTFAVNDAGWITAASDENGYITQYDYDAMGRVKRIDYPADDAVAWNSTTQAFEFMQVNEFGVPPGHWRQTVATGNARKVTYFDALLRPVLSQEYDAADQVGTQRLQMFTHDADGRQTFSSYPVSDFPVPWKGTWSSYDAVGRPTSVAQDSELGLLVSTTQYLSGGQVVSTNPRGQSTVGTFQSLSEPSYDRPMAIRSPEGVVTEFHRDVFGKPLTITRRSSDGGQAVSRQYVYSTNQRLCKTVEPETGTTLMDYDAAGNLVWSVAGLDYPNLAVCNSEAIVASGRAAWRGYDVRNRPVHLRFPDNNGNTDWVYTPDGLPSLLTVWNDEGTTSAFSYYTYNKRRLLSVETSGQMGWYEWPIAYSYNANGHLAGQVWPSGLTVDYAPDALGQATRVGAFASGVRYYANGGIKQFTYGNGIVHSMQQNERQLPARTTDSGVLDFDTRFDPNGNVSDIFDLALGPFYNRHMSYDGLDRLVAAGSNNFGGDYWHRFTYDALDNLKSWTLPGVKDHHYWYDARNQLTNVRDGAGNTVIGLTYDVQGNLRAKNGVTHNFDLGNRLRGVVGSETYRYDALGRRILAYSPTAGNVLSHYAQDGRLVFQSDGRKGVGREFVHLAGSLIAQREYNAAGATISYLHTDALGSPVASTNQAGAVVERTHYEPYGAPIGKVVDGPGYTGHIMDGATGLSYMQQRYYDPQLGVFLSVDPVTAYSNGDARYFNRYWYGAGNPYKFLDPDGREIVYAGTKQEKKESKSLVRDIRRSGPLGRAFISDLRESQQEILVSQGASVTLADGTMVLLSNTDGGVTIPASESVSGKIEVVFDKNNLADYPATDGTSATETPAGLVLHELGHGTLLMREDASHATPGPAAESAVRVLTNPIREEMELAPEK